MKHLRSLFIALLLAFSCCMVVSAQSTGPVTNNTPLSIVIASGTISLGYGN